MSACCGTEGRGRGGLTSVLVVVSPIFHGHVECADRGPHGTVNGDHTGPSGGHNFRYTLAGVIFRAFVCLLFHRLDLFGYRREGNTGVVGRAFFSQGFGLDRFRRGIDGGHTAGFLALVQGLLL